MTRHDVPAEEVARRWLEGETIAALASSYQADAWTIGDRLKKARVQFPELPWDNRKQPERITVSPSLHTADFLPSLRKKKPH